MNETTYIIGAKQVKKALNAGKASKIYIASDCDSHISEPVQKTAEEHNISIEYVPTRRELGEMCGINVKASCAAQI